MKTTASRSLFSDKSAVFICIDYLLIVFSSSSTAATLVLGYNVSGPQTWKNKDGKTLKEIEDSKTGK
ncbi:MAG: DUF4357 domain-containing protein [Clostridiales bacterium]|nr:DUF4357 domain-containing protein [Clostridiales bacterium]